MAKIIIWDPESDINLPVEDRKIIEKTEIIQNRESRFTIKELKSRKEMLRVRINTFQAQIANIQEKINAIKTALGITSPDV